MRYLISIPVLIITRFLHELKELEDHCDESGESCVGYSYEKRSNYNRVVTFQRLPRIL